MAMKGYGYWALVAMTVTSPIILTSCLWLASGWVPGRPSKSDGIVQMLRFGGTVTVSGLVGYIAFNFDKILLGRYCGAGALGIYGRAYQLVSIPSDHLSSAVGSVAESVLSRLQNVPDRQRSYFVKCYSLIIGVTLPLTILFSLYADEIVSVILGPHWHKSAVAFRLFAPSVLMMSLIVPLSWLLFSMGKVRRCLNLALILAVLMITGYIIALPYGPNGVAFSYSAVLSVWVLPHIALSVRGTVVSFRDTLEVLKAPLVSGIVATPAAVIVLAVTRNDFAPSLRLVVGTAAFTAIYVQMLIGPMGQRKFYIEVIEELRGSRSRADVVKVS